MTYRESCATIRGVLDHQAAGEPLCGFCARAEAVARVIAEGVPERPPALADDVRPVTAREQSAHRNVLLAALGIADEYPHGSDGLDDADELARRRPAKGAA